MNTIDHGPRDSAAAAPQEAASTAETDCEKLADVLDHVEAGEASADELEYLIDHAQDCSPCFSTIDKQRLFIAFLQGNVQQKGVPASLANAIRVSIEHFETVQ